MPPGIKTALSMIVSRLMRTNDALTGCDPELTAQLKRELDELAQVIERADAAIKAQQSVVVQAMVALVVSEGEKRRRAAIDYAGVTTEGELQAFAQGEAARTEKADDQRMDA